MRHGPRRPLHADPARRPRAAPTLREVGQAHGVPGPRNGSSSPRPPPGTIEAGRRPRAGRPGRGLTDTRHPMSGGSIRIRTGSLTPRAIRAAWAAFSAAASAAPLPGGTRTSARSHCSPGRRRTHPGAVPRAVRTGSGTGPSTSASPGSPTTARNPASASAVPATRPPSGTPAETRARPARRAPAPRARRDPTVRAPARAAGSAPRRPRPCPPPPVHGPAPPRRSTVAARPRRPADRAATASSSRRAATRRRTRPRRRARHPACSRRARAHPGRCRAPARVPTSARARPERPPQLLRGPPRAHDLGPQPVPTALGHSARLPRPAGTTCTAGPRRPAPPAVPRSAGSEPAPDTTRTGHPRYVPTPGTCTSTGPCRRPSRPPARRGSAAGRPAPPRPARGPRPPRSARAARSPAPAPARRPAAAPTVDQLRRLDGAAPTPQQESALVMSGPQQQYFPGMRLRRVLLTVAVVAVVPDDDASQIPYGRMAARSPRRPGPTTPHGQPLAIPLLGWPAVQTARCPSPSTADSAASTPCDGPAVRHDDERAPPRGERRAHGSGDLLGPAGPRQRVPHGPRCPARRATRGRPPPARIASSKSWLRVCRAEEAARARASVRPARCAAGPRAAACSGEAPRVPVGDGARESQQLGPEHWARATRPARARPAARRSRTRRAARRSPVDQPPALAPALPHPCRPAPEPHPDPHARLCLGIQLRGHGVVEIAVEVQHTLVDENACDRQLLGELRPPPRPRLRLGRPGLPHPFPNQRKLLGRRALLASPDPTRSRCSQQHSYQHPPTPPRARDRTGHGSRTPRGRFCHGPLGHTRSRTGSRMRILRGDHTPEVPVPIAPDATTSVLPSSKRQRTMIQNHRARPGVLPTEVTAAIAPGDPDLTNRAPTRTTDLPTHLYPPAAPAPRGLPPANGGRPGTPEGVPGLAVQALLTDRRPCAGPPRGPCAPT